MVFPANLVFLIFSDIVIFSKNLFPLIVCLSFSLIPFVSEIFRLTKKHWEMLPAFVTFVWAKIPVDVGLVYSKTIEKGEYFSKIPSGRELIRGFPELRSVYLRSSSVGTVQSRISSS